MEGSEGGCSGGQCFGVPAVFVAVATQGERSVECTQRSVVPLLALQD